MAWLVGILISTFLGVFFAPIISLIGGIVTGSIVSMFLDDKFNPSHFALVLNDNGENVDYVTGTYLSLIIFTLLAVLIAILKKYGMLKGVFKPVLSVILIIVILFTGIISYLYGASKILYKIDEGLSSWWKSLSRSDALVNIIILLIVVLVSLSLAILIYKLFQILQVIKSTKKGTGDLDKDKPENDTKIVPTENSENN